MAARGLRQDFIESHGAGNIACTVQGPLDKGNILEDILLDIAAASGDGSAPCIFVGDSVGDLSALLVANFPIVLGHNPMLDHALRTFGCALL
jgi:phosphoserine phosphatase